MTTRFNRVHAVCAHLRKKPCEKCPAREKSEYGWIVRGCRLQAQEVVNIAVSGNPWGRESNRDEGVKAWRKRYEKTIEALYK